LLRKNAKKNFVSHQYTPHKPKFWKNSCGSLCGRFFVNFSVFDQLMRELLWKNTKNIFNLKKSGQKIEKVQKNAIFLTFLPPVPTSWS